MWKIEMPLEHIQQPLELSELFRATLDLIQEELYDKHKQISRYLTPQYCLKHKIYQIRLIERTTFHTLIYVV